ncbi:MULTISPECIES: ParA family protein [unclassified Marinobacter]|uniref:ParA family protein n=1 Tax=unclassified Marinobacter TaxID=83889 RepID=UPI001926C916|nr:MULTISPECIES: ParA family protein [unclassified Marinobacter]MBL3823259.1 ParA family protein [Marinobacter sp. MC3]MBL3892410.1 ParA family protein [Marinobacter sp. MW3]
MRTIAFYSPKGGVGKTASAVNIAYLASESGCSTLLWDLDSQGAASFYLSGGEPGKGKKISKLLEGKVPIAEFIEENVYPGLDFIPAHKSFRNLDIRIEEDERSLPLKSMLAPLAEETSLVVLDCPPGQSRLTEQVLRVADVVYVPLVPTWLSMNSWRQFRDFVRDKKLGQKKLRPFFTLVDRRKKLHRELCEQAPDLFDRHMEAMIPYSSAVERMGEEGLPLEILSPRSNPAQSYRKLWKEIQSELSI